MCNVIQLLKNKILIFTTKQKEREATMLCEISKMDKNKYWMSDQTGAK